jgi:serum/glucocorticoid-regulated kinase 2
MNERIILETLRSPFIVNMHYAFQDREHLYLVLDFKKGGDLRYQMAKSKKFTEEQLKFFTCCILLGLKYIHSKGVIHRDVKPENLVFDEAGFLYITDFGISRNFRPDNKKDTSGTPGYMAPEVIFRQNHSFSVDFYALGTVLFELVTGKRPYAGKERREIRESMICKQVKLIEGFANVSKELSDFVNRLMTRKACYRLGSGGFEEISKHSWLKDTNWEAIETQSALPPFKPKLRESFDPKACSEFKDELDFSIDLTSSQGLFIGYSFDNRLNESRVYHNRKSLTLL